MNKLLFFSIFILGCGEREVKKLIIEPDPPAPVVQAPADCQVKFNKQIDLRGIAEQAASATELCNLTEDQLIELFVAH